MVNIIHKVVIKAPLATVYNALATIEGIASWWIEDTEGVPKPGGHIDVYFHTPSGERRGSMRMEVTALEPDKAVHWRIQTGPEEWRGTEVAFKLHRDGDYTVVMFSHRNWREESELMAHCSTKWAVFMLSLKELAETGKGKPAPHDVKIDNWN